MLRVCIIKNVILIVTTTVPLGTFILSSDMDIRYPLFLMRNE